MSQEKLSCETWEAIRDLYRWRRGTANAQTRSTFDRIHARPRNIEDIEKVYPEQVQAYRMWKAHPREDVFFQLNYVCPEDP
jgi:hypothetical protein